MLSTKYADSIYSQCLFLRVWVWAEPALNEGLKGMSGASKWQATGVGQQQGGASQKALNQNCFTSNPPLSHCSLE